MKGEIPELTHGDFVRAIPGAVRRRLSRGEVRSGGDVTALRRFVGMTQEEFVRAVGMSIDTIQNWGQACPETSPNSPGRIAAGCQLVSNISTASIRLGSAQTRRPAASPGESPRCR